MRTARQQALEWLVQVVADGKSVNQLLAAPIEQLPGDQQPLAKQLLFGSLRYYHRLNTIAGHLLDKPLKAKDTDIQLILALGIYQLAYLSTPDHAAISESVELARYRKKPWAAGLVNGILRRYQRESDQLDGELAKSQQYRFSHPGWMIKRLQQDWAQEAESILQQNNQQPPMTLRVNSLQTNRDAYLQALNDEAMAAEAHPLAKDALVLAKAVDVAKLPGFSEGLVSVQDAAAQLAVEFLDLQPEQRVLDACAAPGGKTTHILQRQPTVDLTAVELSESRAVRIRESLDRLKLECRLICGDMTRVSDWWDGQLFDRILLDVPCSASGVIRRNPDIKIHRKNQDIAALQSLQAEILAQTWPMLAPGGVLVYATCSVFKAENEQQVSRFCETHGAQLLPTPELLASSLNQRAAVGLQILPGEKQMDGFYLCALQKSL